AGRSRAVAEAEGHAQQWGAALPPGEEAVGGGRARERASDAEGRAGAVVVDGERAHRGRDVGAAAERRPGGAAPPRDAGRGDAAREREVATGVQGGTAAIVVAR